MSLWIPEQEIRASNQGIKTVRFSESYLFPSYYIFQDQELLESAIVVIPGFAIDALANTFYAMAGESDMDPQELEKKILDLYQAHFGDFDNMALRFCKVTGQNKIQTKSETSEFQLDYVISLYRGPGIFNPPCIDSQVLDQLASFLLEDFDHFGALKLVDVTPWHDQGPFGTYKFDTTIVGNLPHTANLRLINYSE